MKTLLKLLLLLLIIPSFAQAQGLDPYEDTPEFLRPQVDPDFPDKSNTPVFSHLFKLVKPDGAGKVLAIKNSTALNKPASTMKLFTGWWALQEGIRELDYLATMLKTSSNAMAQSTLNLLGSNSDMENYYSNLGLTVNEHTFRVADGSGLSYSNKSNCIVQIQLLEMILASNQYVVYRDLLAQPGETGTLRNRLHTLKGKVFAKTGTLNRTAALSGFIEAPQGTIVFCVLSDFLNHSLQYERKRIDAMVIENYNRAL
ncbi:MAG: hypothetical protein CME71_09310 [Halobacteriovorax sp.]|nr:hypothetical protein [Halobacteriovorax sp.]|tara:strand:+ start:413 stop:1183 length:771 start_codon:yes stop_codon:yes gene_type:complete